MADALLAYKQAFSSFRKNLVDYLIYSALTSALGAILGIMVILAFLSLGIVSAGTVASVIANAVSFSSLGMVLTILVILAGLLIFALLQGGLTGAYIETVAGLLSGRRQTFAGFFSQVPRQAAPMFWATLAAGIIASLPALAGIALGVALGITNIPGLAVTALGSLLSLLISVLFVFVPVSAVIGNRGPMQAMGDSLSKIVRSPVAFVIFLFLSALLCIPAAIPLFNILYVPFVLLPVGYSALVSFYKQ